MSAWYIWANLGLFPHCRAVPGWSPSTLLIPAPPCDRSRSINLPPPAHVYRPQICFHLSVHHSTFNLPFRFRALALRALP